MATNYTEHYGLSLWEANDKFYHQEFNENHQKIDDALAGKADAAETAALRTDVNSLKAAKITLVTGSYTGSGQYGEAYPNRLSFPMTPKLVIIRPVAGSVLINLGLVLVRGVTNCMCALDINSNSNLENIITWSGSMVSWYCSHDAFYQMNYGNTTYYYVAIG